MLIGAVGASFAATSLAPDPFFPAAGSSAYSVSGYRLGISYFPGNGAIRARAMIAARASSKLKSFKLDLRRPPIVSAVTVNGRSAGNFRATARKLIVRPKSPISAGSEFSVKVLYRGVPERLIDADKSSEGWISTGDGVTALGEPQGSPTWFPCNDRLSEKAAFTFRINVPRGFRGIANGRLATIRSHGGRRTWIWRQSDMTPYLATLTIGRGKITRGDANGVPSWSYVGKDVPGDSGAALSKLPDTLSFLSDSFGPYPFDSTGLIISDSGIEYALETQARPTFGRVPGQLLIVHELAHQWFGDSVGLARWKDIWLNEGFATWAEWYWSETHGGRTAAETAAGLLSEPANRRDLWDPPPGTPSGPNQLFANSIYLRGGLVVEELREQIGETNFFSVLRSWTAQHRHGNATTEEFIALAESVSGQDLSDFFRRWLFARGRP